MLVHHRGKYIIGNNSTKNTMYSNNSILDSACTCINLMDMNSWDKHSTTKYMCSQPGGRSTLSFVGFPFKSRSSMLLQYIHYSQQVPHPWSVTIHLQAAFIIRGFTGDKHAWWDSILAFCTRLNIGNKIFKGNSRNPVYFFKRLLTSKFRGG